MPGLYIITGSNGAGKSSVGPIYLPPHIKQRCKVFDGDKLFMQKQKELWSTGTTAIKEAKKIALAYVESTFDELVGNALQHNTDFVYEGHFTNDATWDIPKLFKQRGYEINLIFLGVANPDLSQLRVIDRVHSGGHYVTRQEIENNFYGNLEKLDKYFGMFDALQIFDTSETSHTLLIQIEQHKVTYAVEHRLLPLWVTQHLPKITALIPE